MLTPITTILFPNKCEVVEIEPREIYVYPIYKNGRSSILSYSKMNNCKILFNEQIKKLNKINIVLRAPMDRFISGVNTFVWNTKRDNPELDINTILYFVENYLFLNRHYAPQVSWLINLSRYADQNVKLVLHNRNYLTTLTKMNCSPTGEEKILSAEVIERLKNNAYNEMYLRLDSLLCELVDEELTFSQLFNYLRNKDPEAYKKISCIALD